MGTHTVFLNPDGIIEIQISGDQDADAVEDMGRKVDELLTEQKKLGKPGLVLDNLLEMGKVDVQARKLVVELAGRLDYDRAAMLGRSGGIMQFGTNLMLHATGRGYKIRFFTDRDMAVAWLKEYENTISS